LLVATNVKKNINAIRRLRDKSQEKDCNIPIPKQSDPIETSKKYYLLSDL